MLAYYAAFGWEEYSRREDRRYFDIIHVKLKRPHRVMNKDRLQLLEVKMESIVNDFAELRKRRHAGSIAEALISLVSVLLLIGFGVYFIVKGVILSLAISLLAFSLVAPTLSVPLIKKRYAEEERSYAAKFKEMTAEISRILLEVKSLSEGVKNED